jgi:Flp pilus assembly protein TadG
LSRPTGERGQALVDFALASLVFLTLLFGVVSMGEALYAYDLTAHAARMGTRWAIVNTPQPANDCAVSSGTCQAQITNYVLAKSGLDASNLTTTISFGGTGTSPSCSTDPSVGCWVNINLQYTFGFALIPLPPITLNSSSQMVIASQY